MSTKMYVGVNNVAKKVDKIYVGINNTAQLCYTDNTPPPLPTIVTWANGTDAQIKAMVDAHYQGLLDLTDYWHVGDKRTVSLNAMTATYVPEAHTAQDVVIVLTNVGGKTLANGGTCAFQWDMENVLYNHSNPSATTENGRMRNDGINGWNGSERRNWCNEVFRDAISSADMKSVLMKEFINPTCAGSKSSTIINTTDYCALRSQVEVLGTYDYSFEGEGSQVTYYANGSNIKYRGTNKTAWWTRSPRNTTTNTMIAIGTGENQKSTYYVYTTTGISVFGVI